MHVNFWVTKSTYHEGGIRVLEMPRLGTNRNQLGSTGLDHNTSFEKTMSFENKTRALKNMRVEKKLEFWK